MFELKPISKDAIPRALEKAERYRLLNEPLLMVIRGILRCLFGSLSSVAECLCFFRYSWA